MAKTYKKKQIAEWLQAHPLINVSKLERACDIPRSGLSKLVNGDEEYLSEKHIPTIVEMLRNYGFK